MVPGPQTPQTTLITILWDLVVWIIVWKNWICLCTDGNARGIGYPKGPGIPGHPNHINYYILGLGGLDYHLGELNLFVYHLKYKEKCISQGSRDPAPPKPY